MGLCLSTSAVADDRRPGQDRPRVTHSHKSTPQITNQPRLPQSTITYHAWHSDAKRRLHGANRGLYDGNVARQLQNRLPLRTGNAFQPELDLVKRATLFERRWHALAYHIQDSAQRDAVSAKLNKLRSAASAHEASRNAYETRIQKTEVDIELRKRLASQVNEINRTRDAYPVLYDPRTASTVYLMQKLREAKAFAP